MQNKCKIIVWVVLAGLMLVAPASADIQAGLDAYERGDFPTALAEFRTLAETGDIPAQQLLMVILSLARGVPQDYEEAARWAHAAAEQGDAMARFNLGHMYFNGQGVAQDYTDAATWYRRAAERGRARAQYNLGAMYSKGQGVPKDLIRAHAYYNIAAAQENESGRKNRDLIVNPMTVEQIAEAQRLARECAEKNYWGCEF